MNTTFTNINGVSLSLLPWLLRDTYDHDEDPNTYSSTYFNNSVRQMVLMNRIKANPSSFPVESVEASKMASSRIGTAIHDAIEASWYDTEAVKAAFALAGLPKRLVDRLVINPPSDYDTSDKFVVWMEQRLAKQLGKYTITGKPDFIINGELTDYKSTSMFVVRGDINAEDYKRQGSIYRMLAPEIITSPILTIDYIVKDFTQGQAGVNGNPTSPLPSSQFVLDEPAVTEKFVLDTLGYVESLANAPDADIPYCTPAELRQDAPTYKYYRNPEKTARSTKNFDNMEEAERLRIKNGAGIVIAVQGKPKTCGWCSVRNICNQYAEMNPPTEPKDELSPDS